MAKVFITGVAGFIGSNLAVRLLEEGHEVVGIDDLSHGLQEQVPEGVSFVKQDIRSKDIYPLFKDVNYVFHLAALSSIPDCQNDPVSACDVNTTGTVNVFEASAKAGVKKLFSPRLLLYTRGLNSFRPRKMRWNRTVFML